MTTAQKLLAFRRELREGRMHPEIIDQLTRDVAHALVATEGLDVLAVANHDVAHPTSGATPGP